MGIASIYSNSMAANTARHLHNNYSSLSSSVQRLSSGLRINSAADDAAGLGIRELMRADVAALQHGMRNANDAISLLQVADGALAIIDEKLIRMKELAEQASTGTYDSTQRLMIDSEFQSMGMEIDRIARATDFNGIKLLDGSLKGEHNGEGLVSTGKMKIHFGTENDSAEDYYYIEIGDCTTAGLGLGSMKAFPAAPPGMEWINDAQIDTAGRRIILEVPDAYAGSGNAAFMKGVDYYSLPVGLENIRVTSNAVNPHPFHKPHVCLFSKNGAQYTGPPVTGSFAIPVKPDGTKAVTSGKSWWNNVTTSEFIGAGTKANVFEAGATYKNYSKVEGVYDTGTMRITHVTGQSEVGSKWNGTAYASGVAMEEIIDIDVISSDLVFFIGGHENPNDGCNRYSLTIEADITQEFLDKMQVWAGNGTDGMAEDMITIETQGDAQGALVKINDAIVKKDKIRAHLGALQNRFENTVANLFSQAANLQAAESRISDADVATEMTSFVRSQIMSNAATAMLGQANSAPQMLAVLLNG